LCRALRHEGAQWIEYEIASSYDTTNVHV
jgi:hypothetical protein